MIYIIIDVRRTGLINNLQNLNHDLVDHSQYFSTSRVLFTEKAKLIFNFLKRMFLIKKKKKPFF